jgi:hypothetical protein
MNAVNSVDLLRAGQRPQLVPFELREDQLLCDGVAEGEVEPATAGDTTSVSTPLRASTRPVARLPALR